MRRATDARQDQGGILADALIGAAAGAVAVWAMDRVDWFNFEHVNERARNRTQTVRPGGMDPARGGAGAKAVRPGGMDPAHTGAKMAADALGYDLEPQDYNLAGLATHYSIGIMPAALYGVLRHRVPGLNAGHGTVFGLGLFFLQDEGLNALTGLSARPDEYPWQAHARGFVAHAVYGLVLETALETADGLRGTNGHRRRRHPAGQRSLEDVAYPLSRSEEPSAGQQALSVAGPA